MNLERVTSLLFMFFVLIMFISAIGEKNEEIEALEVLVLDYETRLTYEHISVQILQARLESESTGGTR